MLHGIGDKFQIDTKHTREKLHGGYLDWNNKPETYKTYPSAKKIPLSSSLPTQPLSLIEILKTRKSIRSFSTKPLNLTDLAFLLWASTGIQRIQQDYEFRTVPSAGALYPIETYLVANNIETLIEGLHHYNIKEHALEELKVGSIGQKIAQAALGQRMCATAPALFLWTAIFQRSKWKYAQRAYRYVYLDAGHIAQNLALSATSIGLGSCHIGAFFDDEINQIIETDGTEESVIYLTAVGHPK